MSARLRLLVLSGTLTACSPLATTPTPTGSVCDAGMAACQGNVLQACDGHTYQVDCGALGGTCGALAGVNACILRAGSTCVTRIVHENHVHFLPLPCAEANTACVQSPGVATCRSGHAACTPGEVGVCRGNVLLAYCTDERQPIIVDCAAYGATCSDARGACVDIAVGGACDRTRKLCAAGTQCVGARDAAEGRCERVM